MTIRRNIVVLGAGPGGLTTALALGRQGHAVQLVEKQAQVQPFSGGIQMGPNAMRVLHALGLEQELQQIVSWPSDLHVRSARSGRSIASMTLDPDMQTRYGAPWATVHRVDLQQLLLQHSENLVNIHYQQTITGVQWSASDPAATALRLQLADGTPAYSAELLIVADGAGSAIRQQLRPGSSLVPSGQTAWRACFVQKALPMHLRSYQVQIWLGAGFHAVTYPVRQGEWLNVVLCLPSRAQDEATQAPQLPYAACTELMDLLSAITHQKHWTATPLAYLPPLRRPEIFLPAPDWPVALVGDAAHAMLPHLAQGAGMAIEDAAVLAQQLRQHTRLAGALSAYAEQRYRRVTKVQRRALRNGTLYQLGGLIGAVRNWTLGVAPRTLLDQPWLYKPQALALGPNWLQPLDDNTSSHMATVPNGLLQTALRPN